MNNFPGKVSGLIIFRQQELSMYAEPNLLFKNPFCWNLFPMPEGMADNIFAIGCFNSGCWDGG